MVPPTTVLMDWKSIGSLLATMVFIRTAIRDFLPPELQHFLRRLFARLLGVLSPTATIIIDEVESGQTNDLYEAAQTYLGSRCLDDAPVVRLAKRRESPLPVASLPGAHTTIDCFAGVTLRWKSCVTERNSMLSRFGGGGHRSHSSSLSEQRFLELSFHGRHRKTVNEQYIPFVIEQAARLRLRNRERRLYTNRSSHYDDHHRLWTSVPFAHPSTFDTLAVDPALRDDIRNDLLRFSERREHYVRVGRAWKRGYLLYGPPGTGKTSLIAAIANLLEFDVYDLELTAVPTNTQLRRLLHSTTPKSIVVIEDVDCSLDLTDRKKKSKSDNLEEMMAAAHGSDYETPSKISLSGVLNFVDGLWSSCVEERLMIFTTNHPERLDPALLRPGRMDRKIELSYCRPAGFRVLARNYLDIGEEHELMGEVEELLQQVNMSPAEVAEVFMSCDGQGQGADEAMKKVMQELRQRKAAATLSPPPATPSSEPPTPPSEPSTPPPELGTSVGSIEE